MEHGMGRGRRSAQQGCVGRGYPNFTPDRVQAYAGTGMIPKQDVIPKPEMILKPQWMYPMTAASPEYYMVKCDEGTVLGWFQISSEKANAWLRDIGGWPTNAHPITDNWDFGLPLGLAKPKRNKKKKHNVAQNDSHMQAQMPSAGDLASQQNKPWNLTFNRNCVPQAETKGDDKELDLDCSISEGTSRIIEVSRTTDTSSEVSLSRKVEDFFPTIGSQRSRFLPGEKFAEPESHSEASLSLRIDRNILDSFFAENDRKDTYDEEKFSISLIQCSDYHKATVLERFQHCDQLGFGTNAYRNVSSVVLCLNASDEEKRAALEEAAEQVESNFEYFQNTGEKRIPETMSKCSVPYLESRSIVPLEEKSERFKSAVYYCRICHVHLNCIEGCINHFESVDHVKAERRKIALEYLKQIPREICENHRKAIFKLLNKEFPPEELREARLSAVHELVQRIQDFLQQEIDKSCKLTLFGSYNSGNFTDASDLNISLDYPWLLYSKGQILHHVLQCFNRFQSDGSWAIVDVVPEFQRSAPSVRLTVKSEKLGSKSLDVCISIQCDRDIRFTNIIAFYCRLRSQFRDLSFLLRRWVEVCSLDASNMGGLPKMAFDIMLIYFLQQKGYLPKPSKEILPLPESESSLQPTEDLEAAFRSYGEDNQDWDLGDLWLQLFTYYALDHDCSTAVRIEWEKMQNEEQQFNKRRIAIRDPCTTDRIMQPSQYFAPYLSNCFLSTYLYFRIPRNADGPVMSYFLLRAMPNFTKKKNSRQSKKKLVSSRPLSTKGSNCLDDGYGKPPDYVAAQKEAENCRTIQEQLRNELHIGEGPSRNTVRAIDQPDYSESEWSEKLLSNEHDKSASVPSVHAEDEFEDDSAPSLTKTQDESMERYSTISTNSDVQNCSPVVNAYSRSSMFNLRKCAAIGQPLVDILKEHDIYGTVDSRDKKLRSSTKTEPLVEEVKGNSNHDTSKGQNDEAATGEFIIELPIFELGNERAADIHFENWLSLQPNYFSFEWKLENFTSNASPEIHCSFCGGSGHLQSDCEEGKTDMPIPLDPLSASQVEVISRVIDNIYNHRRIKQSQLETIESLRAAVEQRLRNHYRKESTLVLFGSAGNGFGLTGSDADMCLRLSESGRLESYDAVEVINDVAHILSAMSGIKAITAVVNAKVPIVKIACNSAYRFLEADVSLYNELAVINTRLLRAYCDCDERVPMLGIALKEWAKCCDIGDASKGSLSSYSYIVMLIHFLQRTTPPVLPFLQEVAPRGKERTKEIVDDWDVYFCPFVDLDWQTENKQPVGELWFDFLDYFTQKFDFRNEVVQIRQQEPLTKLDKGWQAKPLAIEDPFDLNHNLSSGIHLRTMMYIKRSFAQSRKKFGQIDASQPLKPEDVGKFANTLYKSCLVGDGLPLDRNCCRRCRQIGHFVENCPLNKRPPKPKPRNEKQKGEQRFSTMSRSFNPGYLPRSYDSGAHGRPRFGKTGDLESSLVGIEHSNNRIIRRPHNNPLISDFNPQVTVNFCEKNSRKKEDKMTQRSGKEKGKTLKSTVVEPT